MEFYDLSLLSRTCKEKAIAVRAGHVRQSRCLMEPVSVGILINLSNQRRPVCMIDFRKLGNSLPKYHQYSKHCHGGATCISKA